LGNPVLSRLAVTLPVLVLLSSCSSSPFPIDPPVAAHAFAEQHPLNQGREPRRAFWEPVRRVQAISLCYGRQFNEPEDLVAVAQDICTGGRVEFYGEDPGWRYCALFQPRRATYICYPEEAAAKQE